MSDSCPAYCGVPQGSAMGHVLFCMCTIPLEDIFLTHVLQSKVHAGDIQLYVACDGDQVPTGPIKECVREIRHWIRRNMLTLYDSKTT